MNVHDFAVTFKALTLRDLQDTDGRKKRRLVNLQMHPTVCITVRVEFLTHSITVNTRLRLDNLRTLPVQPSRCDRGGFTPLRQHGHVFFFFKKASLLWNKSAAAAWEVNEN